MSSDSVVDTEGLGKCYRIYQKPRDRLFQMFFRRKESFYREFWALRDVSLSVRRGETVGIVGRNGSGKSTLLQLVCGTLNPTVGRVSTRGRVAALLELGSGFNPEFSGRENVYLNASLLGLSRTQIDERFESIAAFAEIGDFIEQPVKIYSSGMFVRLAFAVIVHVDADVLIIDEALSVGDAAFSRKCTRFLRSFMANGTVLFVSHDTASVKSLCHRVVWLDQGRLLADGDPKTVSDAYLRHLYETQQGVFRIPVEKTNVSVSEGSEHSLDVWDMRRDFINQSNLRNDLCVFEMKQESPSFGKGGVRLLSVSFVDAAGRSLSWVVGGELVSVVIHAVAREALGRAIVGFAFKDRLGQYLFGDNTHLSTLDRPCEVKEGEKIVARFEFRMPVFKPGEYSVDVAVADGVQLDHVQQLWVHDALTFKSTASSVCNGLIGIPIHRIVLSIGAAA